ncbi:MAG: IclR family transcriptional regulator [Eubacteriales bacterium]|nr:IclR family transcriptional regulator [Eubacteriales bacterium]
MSKTLNEAIKILDTLREHSQLTLTQIAGVTNMNKSSVYRLLTALIDNELVDKDKNTKMYRLGLGLLRYAPTLLNSKNLVRIARPFLAKLVSETNESAQLCTITHRNTIITIDAQNSRGYINLSANIGTEDPLHCTAVGKAYLAYLSDNQRDMIIDEIELKRFTKNTITTKKDLIAELNVIHGQGYAIDNEEIIEGIRCFASPILDESGNPIAVIGITGPANRILESETEKYVNAVKNIASQLSSKLCGD